MLCAIDRVILLRGGAEVFALLEADAGKFLPDQVNRPVGREGIDQIDLVRPFHRPDAVLDVVPLVEGGDDGGDGDAGHGLSLYRGPFWSAAARRRFFAGSSLPVGPQQAAAVKAVPRHRTPKL